MLMFIGEHFNVLLCKLYPFVSSYSRVIDSRREVSVEQGFICWELCFAIDLYP